MSRWSSDIRRSGLVARRLMVLAPLLLFAYGLLLLGAGGRRSGGLWTIGHLLFLCAMACFALLAVLTPRLLLRVGRPLLNALCVATAVAVVAGAIAFMWVILGDISAAIREAVRVPDRITTVAPALLVVGLVLLSGQLAVAYLGRWWLWAPALTLVGLILISVDLDLIPIGAILLLLAFVPVSRAMGRRSVAVGSSSR